MYLFMWQCLHSVVKLHAFHWITVYFQCDCYNIHYVSKKRTTTINDITSQHLLIIFGREKPYSVLNWCPKKFSNWLRTSCVVSTTTVETWHIRTVNFWADFEQRISDREINEWQNDCGPVSRPKDCTMNSCCNFWHCTLLWCKHCLFQRLNFSVHKIA